MSCRIEYQWAVIRVPPTSREGPERFIVAIEGGDHNTSDRATGKAARRWEVCMIGNAHQVMKRAVLVAGECDAGTLKPKNRDCTPEDYIRRIRRLLREPSAPPPAYWTPRMRAPIDHPAIAEARKLNLAIEEEVRYGDREGLVRFRPEELPRLFDFVDRFPDLPPWRFAEVSGFASSLSAPPRRSFKRARYDG
jgi:hypothetical protein